MFRNFTKASYSFFVFDGKMLKLPSLLNGKIENVNYFIRIRAILYVTFGGERNCRKSMRIFCYLMKNGGFDAVAKTRLAKLCSLLCAEAL